MYEYNYVYTIAQLELIACDVPIVVYDRKKKDRKARKKGEKRSTDDFKKAKALDVLQAADQWERKYSDKGGKDIAIDLSNFKTK